MWSLPGKRSIAWCSVASGWPTIVADVRLLVDALPDELEPEQIAVERERALEVGDLVAGVMCTDDRHDGSLIGTRKLRWNSQTGVLSWL